MSLSHTDDDIITCFPKFKEVLYINQHTEFEVRSFTDSKNIIGAKFKTTAHVTLTTPIRELSVIESQALDIFYLHTKFGDCRFSRS